MRRLVGCMAVVAFVVAAAAVVCVEGRVIDVYMTHNPPFGLNFESTGDRRRGYDVELLEAVMSELRASEPTLSYVLHEVVSRDEVIAAVAAGDANTLGISGLSISSEWEESVDFSYAYFNTGLDIMVKREDVRTDIMLFFKPFSIWAWIVAVIALYFSGHVIWILERNYQPSQFPRGYFQGLNESVWYCWGILSETGEKDLVGFASRLYSIGWSTFTIIIVSTYTAILVLTLTLSSLNQDINQPEELAHERVATVIGTAGEAYLRDHMQGSHMFAYPTISAAFHAIENEEVTAMIYDAATLEYLAANGQRGYRMFQNLLTAVDYGIAVNTNSTDLDAVNRIVVQLTESGYMGTLNTKYFGRPFLDALALDDIESPSLTFIAVSGVYILVFLGFGASVLLFVYLRCNSLL